MRRFMVGRKPRTGGRYFSGMMDKKNNEAIKEERKEENKKTEKDGMDIFGTVIEVAFGVTLFVVTIIGMSDLLKEAMKNPAQAFWDASFSVVGGLIIGLVVLVIFAFFMSMF